MRVFCSPRCLALSRRSTLWQAGPSPRRLPVGSLPRPPPTTGGISHTRAREQHPVPPLPPTPRQSSHISQCSQGCPWPDSVPLLHLRTERTSRQAASGTLVRVPASFLIPAPLRRRLPDARAVGSGHRSPTARVWSPLPPSGQRTRRQTQTLSLSRHQRSWVGLALLTFAPLGRMGQQRPRNLPAITLCHPEFTQQNKDPQEDVWGAEPRPSHLSTL